MELPLGGPALRHYTQSRPRPHRQKLNYRPSRPQETIIESEHEVLELMGRVDEGVEEFFTKRVLPTDTLKNQDEEIITVHEAAPASSVPCPPQTKTLRRKLGDFFTLKKRRGLKSEPSLEGRPKKASIADFIRPLREVARAEKDKEKDRVKEHDRENEKEKAKDGESAVQETPVSGAAPLRGDAAPPRRALREGKSQSLILLSGSAAAGHTNARNTAKKQFEGQNSFEQKLHLMLQRIGVSKAPPEETQNQEGEMKKAESEGTIIDSKPEPPASFSKPRTMSASSDTRHQIRPSVSAHESAGKPALLPKPVIKPGAAPTTSGRNTPDNELAQIQEGETNTPTKVSPTAAPSPPPAPTAATIPTVPTMSDSIPDSSSPSSTVAPSDTDICTDSVNFTAAATIPTNATKLESTASEGSAATPTLPTTTTLTTLTSTSTPTDPPATVSVISTSSVPIPPSPSVTSDLTTTTTPSITTIPIESVSAPISEGSVCTASLNLSPISTLPELNGILSVDASPGDTAVFVYTTAASPSTSISTAPSCLSTITNSVTEASDDSTLVSSPCCVTLLSPVAENTSPTSNSYDAFTATVSPDAPVTTSSTLIAAAPPLPSSTTTRSPTPSDCINSIPAPAVTHPVIPSPTDNCVPFTSCVETTPTDTTSTTTTTTTLNHAETTPTISSATTAAVSSTLATDSDPTYFNNVTTTLTIPATPTIYVSDSSSATSQHLTSPAHSNDRPGQDKDPQTSPEEQPSAEPAWKSTDEELEMVQKSKQTEMDEEKGVVDDERRHEKPPLVSSEETRKEVQEESEKAEEDTVAEPLPGKEGEWCEVSDEVEVKEGEVEEGVVEGPKQEETKSAGEK
ncbi:mucin-2-like [Platichthys flesus]|uniref:mucin-2-like n=1 Tax=Platichthys flesus TaxID=8260 RepID=UPI002DBC1B95|nr:mucin-2-like [Platichthys flesus]